MAQAPATPKFTRLLHRLRATLLGPNPHLPSLQPSEAAALALRTARRSETWGTPQDVVFLIPLVGPHAVNDWARVTGLLNRTLSSLVGQSDTRWRAIVCCQERPVMPDDPRLSFVPFDDPEPGNDKWRKLAALYSELARTADTPSLAMTFDADDLAAPSLVANLLSHPEGSLLTRGLILDAGNNRIARAVPQSLLQPGGKAFWKLCGSCAALPIDPSQNSAAEQCAFLSAMSGHEHRMVPYLAKLAGLNLTKLDAPDVLYLLNHGENFGARRGRVSFKTRYVERFALTDPSEEKKAREIYNL